MTEAKDAPLAKSKAPADSPKPEKKTGSKKNAPVKPEEPAGLGAKIDELKVFFEEAKVELKKITWPDRKTTTATCIAVFVLVLVMSLFLGVVDFGLTELVKLILS